MLEDNLKRFVVVELCAILTTYLLCATVFKDYVEVANNYLINFSHIF
jgi:hypothetical protein